MLTDLLDPGQMVRDATIPAQVIVLAAVIIPMVTATVQAIFAPPNRTRFGALVLTTTWNAVWLLAGNELAVQLGWWTFGDAGPTIGHTPVALWLGWTLLWGPVAAQLTIRPTLALALLAGIDLMFMPLMGDAVVLGDTWLIGEAVLLTVAAWPGLLLIEWTSKSNRLREYVGLQVIMFAAMLGWAIPRLATADSSLALQVSPWTYGIVLFGLILASLPGLTAVNDFYLNGGSPWPWDWTHRPVRSGPYRYVRSPMQLSAILVLLMMAVVYREPAVLAAAVSALLYPQLFCQLEHTELSEHFGAAWTDLALDQRRWIPSFRPNDSSESAIVWVDPSCDICAPVARFLETRSPVALQIRPAATHNRPLTRLRYERADGAVFKGVAGVGAALEHLHLGWAMVGWLLRLPVVWRLWQLIGDAVGFGPRPAVQADNNETPSCRTQP